MTRPDYTEIVRLANEYDIIPVCREIYADITTPIAILRRISRSSNRYFLLESIEGEKNGAGIHSWATIQLPVLFAGMGRLR